MSQISAEIYGTLEVSVEGSSSTITVSIGTPGPAGTNGTNGAAATIAVGTTTTLSPGASATVTNAGTSSAAVFNFGIPAGQKGDTGDTGATGATGATGSPGAAATIAAGTTTTGAAGSSASVANSGTSSAAVFDFTIPRGDKGDQGDQGDPGVGVPAGGTTGQYLVKASGTDYDFTFASGTFNGGTIGNPLTVIGTGSSTLSDSSLTFGGTTTYTNSGITFNDSTVQTTAYVGGAMPTGGSAGQSLLKVSGTNWDTTWGTPALATASETVIATVRNATGSTLTAGQVVYIDGAVGNRPSVALAKADVEATSAGTYGMVSTPIANNTDGTIVIAGYVANLDTSAFTDGDKLYLSPSVAGGWTATKPSAPDNLVYVGVIARAHPTLGVIQLRISNGFELDELHDVSAASPSNSDLLAFETSTNLWKNKSAATLGLAKLASPTLTGTPLSTTAAADTNSTQIATTAFVVGQASSTTPAATGTAAVGTSLKYARADHVHANPLPTGGTANQVLSKVDGTDYNVQWATASGGGGGVDIQTFGSSSTSGSFTWTKPSGAKWVEIILYGGGGGGGSGARRATSAARGGGGGGGGGGYCHAIFSASFLSSTETVVVGAGGSGGASQTVDSNGGNNGNNGGTTTLKDYRALGGNFGSAGNAGYVPGGAAVIGSNMWIESTTAGSLGGSGEATSGTTVTLRNNNCDVATGGGGGGGAGASSTANASGGNGGPITINAIRSGLSTAISGGTAGNSGTTPTPATAGTSATNRYFQGGTGGGGGYYKTGVGDGVANGGGAGGWPAGGGGGGGATDNGFASGAGGAGANGFAVIITYT